MKKAIIKTGGKQYIVTEGQTFDVDLINSKDKKEPPFMEVLFICFFVILTFLLNPGVNFEISPITFPRTCSIVSNQLSFQVLFE